MFRTCGDIAPSVGVCVPNVETRDSAPSPHGRLDNRRGHGCGERAGVRGVGDTRGPLTPALAPAVESLPQAMPIAGERGQELTSRRRLDAHPETLMKAPET